MSQQALWFELMQFYIREAWLLDERKFREWLDLFTEDEAAGRHDPLECATQLGSERGVAAAQVGEGDGDRRSVQHYPSGILPLTAP